MSKNSEEDVKNKVILPAIEASGWDKNQMNFELGVTSVGEITVVKNIAKRKRERKADIVLTKKINKDFKLAVVEAKNDRKPVSEGLEQAKYYAEKLDVYFAYSSNGKGFTEYDFFTGIEKNLGINEFPTEEQLWNRYLEGKNLNQDQVKVISDPFYVDYSGDSKNSKKPRYYQAVAIQKTIEAIAKGQKRILLVMATGTGKTYTAFQIVHRLRENKIAKRVLFLADRNILIDQTMNQDFKPFAKVMTKVQDKKPDSAYEVYMSLYQQLDGDEGKEPFREFDKGFFDLIIVDEAHRGSAKEESRWRKILEYFSSAIQIGMTATPKETKYISNIEYFGEPVYTYSLKQGIEDGFLAPYNVTRIFLNKDIEGYYPEPGKLDVEGELVEERLYTTKDFNRNIVIDERTKVVAKEITKWLHENGRYSKTIVFCVDIEHAERMRQALANENSDLMKENHKYIMRITGDSPEGKKQLDYFIDVDSKYPTIVTTSKLLTTGVDVKTCKLIVLDSNITSMTEFKQIIGRGTRIVDVANKDIQKMFFTIMDFQNVTHLFKHPDFDGTPMVIKEIKNGDETVIKTTDEDDNQDTTICEPAPDLDETNTKKKIRVNGVDVKVSAKHVEYILNGKLTTESIVDYSKRNILNQYATLDDFIHNWKAADKKSVILEELEKHGVMLEHLKDEIKKDYDDFDLIVKIAFDQEPLTKTQRIKWVREKGLLSKFSKACQEVLSALLDKYHDGSIKDLENTKILETAPFDKLGKPWKITDYFGGKEAYLQAVSELQNWIYEIR
ncbi:restriction endonuclease subunit R [Mycoplasmopsis agassizii]|uniref:Restriction endonuclease subunit R n=1 Tax=Mycoplasmopsis agassizii TaxID=33922 RepID=A0A269TIZ2_9BACT|nr:DEAD/DEAH box helicase family protein [Mycoplasmopsis agassizii]PAK21357.1 restriction endonuclease subunit R [Mycoplasmopsis agassizii]